MSRTIFAIGVAGVILFCAGNSVAQRGGRGGGGARAGGIGGVGGGARPAGVGTYGTAASPPRVSTLPSNGQTVVGPGGGTRTSGSGSGSYTTQRGSTINYGGAGTKGTTAGGVNYGKGVGGVQVTTPGGKEVTKVGTAGGAVGPGGNAVGSRAGVTTGSGPGGSFSTAYKGGVAVGPQGAAAAGGRVGTATGPGGTVSGASRSAAVASPWGAAAGRTTVARGSGGTFYASRTTLATTGNAVRANWRSFATQYPVLTARWLGPTWRPITWGALSGYCGYSAYASAPVYYDYGETVVYQGDNVVVNGDTEIPAEQYTQQAVDIANTGVEAKADPKEGEWKPLGVFAMVGEGEEKSTNLFQLAINKDGVIGGEYYNALTDETSPIRGAVDNKTQRAAWSVADKKFPIYEAGIANLTRDETSMLVHYSKERSQQFTLVRLPPPEGEQPASGK